MNDRELLRIAKEASLNAYVPYSGFPVGAALECEDGTVYTGCNVENAAYGDTICAERCAVVKAVSEGQEKGVLEASEADMISNIFEFSDKEAQDIMTHRASIVAVDGSMTLKDAVSFMLECMTEIS